MRGAAYLWQGVARGQRLVEGESVHGWDAGLHNRGGKVYRGLKYKYRGAEMEGA